MFPWLWLQSGDTQTFAQKLQLRVPSMESLFRSPIKESLFRSSKESLARTSSRESLNQLDLDSSAATFDPPSDMENEAEDSPWNSDSLNREQLLQRLRRMERSLSSYRGKYSEVGAWWVLAPTERSPSSRLYYFIVLTRGWLTLILVTEADSWRQT